MHPFEKYLRQYHLEALTVAIMAQVRYLVVYNAVKGNPINPQHARQIRRTVFDMTGIPFTEHFALTDTPSINELPTLPIRKLPIQRLH